jgi:hypothetical protein
MNDPTVQRTDRCDDARLERFGDQLAIVCRRAVGSCLAARQDRSRHVQQQCVTAAIILATDELVSARRYASKHDGGGVPITFGVGHPVDERVARFDGRREHLRLARLASANGPICLELGLVGDL